MRIFFLPRINSDFDDLQDFFFDDLKKISEDRSEYPLLSSFIFLNQNKIYELKSCKLSKSLLILGKKKSWARKNSYSSSFFKPAS